MDEATILTAQGQPFRKKGAADRCPRCGEGPSRRVASSGFGVPFPICGNCGYEWPDQVWTERTERRGA